MAGWGRSVRLRRLLLVFAFSGLLPVAPPAAAQSFTDSEREEERSLVDSIQAELAPRVCSLVGFQRCEPIPTDVWIRAELRRWMEDNLEHAFPNDEWSRLGRCLAEIGLVRRKVDLQGELIDLIVSQAGAGYNTALGSYVSLLDVPSRMKSTPFRRMIIAHELTHAFQDRTVDMEALHFADLSSLDRAFAHRAVFEGMASVAMYSLARGLPLDNLPDVSAFMAETFTRSADEVSASGSGKTPPLLIRHLFEPYVQGTSFVQDLLRARPEEPLVSLLTRMPESGEQILHPEKYLSGDMPTPLDISRIASLLQKDWQEFHHNEVGEQDLRLLFELHGSTPEEAAGAAAGWDGFVLAGYVDREGSLALVGLSAWDSPEDAEEFGAPFKGILSGLHGEGRHGVRVVGSRVVFTVGFSPGLAEEILALAW